MECRPKLVSFSRAKLLQLYSVAPPTAAVVDIVRRFRQRAVCCLRCFHGNARINRPTNRYDNTVFVSCYRGRRSGRYRPPPTPLLPPPRVRVRRDRHTVPQGQRARFGSLNIASARSMIYSRYAMNTTSTFCSSLKRGTTPTQSACVDCGPTASTLSTERARVPTSRVCQPTTAVSLLLLCQLSVWLPSTSASRQARSKFSACESL